MTKSWIPVRENKFLVISALILLIIFSLSLLQNYFRYGVYEGYDVQKTIVYLVVSVLLFFPFLVFSLKFYHKVLNKARSGYGLWSGIFMVMVLLIFYGLANVILHTVGFFNHYLDPVYARQYFGREALYHLILLVGTAVYVYRTKNTERNQLIKVTDGRNTINLRADAIQWIEAEDHYLNFYTENQKFIKRATLETMSKLLAPDFIRIHRKYLVNKNLIKAREKRQRNEFVILDNGEKLKVGRSYAANL